MQGIAGIREVYVGILAARPTLELQTLAVTRAGDIAMLHGKWILRTTGQDGGQVFEGRAEHRNCPAPAGRYLAVRHRQSLHAKLTEPRRAMFGRLVLPPSFAYARKVHFCPSGNMKNRLRRFAPKKP